MTPWLLINSRDVQFKTINPNPLLAAGRNPTLRTPLVPGEWDDVSSHTRPVSGDRPQGQTDLGLPEHLGNPSCFCAGRSPLHPPCATPSAWHYAANLLVTSEDAFLLHRWAQSGGKFNVHNCSGFSPAGQVPTSSTANLCEVWFHPDPLIST